LQDILKGCVVPVPLNIMEGTMGGVAIVGDRSGELEDLPDLAARPAAFLEGVPTDGDASCGSGSNRVQPERPLLVARPHSGI